MHCYKKANLYYGNQHVFLCVSILNFEFAFISIYQQLIESHQRFIVELQQRANTVGLIRQAAAELIKKASGKSQTDISIIETQLNHLSQAWDRVQSLSEKRIERLKQAMHLVSS